MLESAGDGPLGESRYQSPVATLCEAADRRLVQCFPPPSCRCQATEAGGREGRASGSNQETEEPAGGGEAETLQGGRSVPRRGEHGERYRSALHRDAE